MPTHPLRQPSAALRVLDRPPERGRPAYLGSRGRDALALLEKVVGWYQRSPQAAAQQRLHRKEVIRFEKSVTRSTIKVCGHCSMTSGSRCCVAHRAESPLVTVLRRSLLDSDPVLEHDFSRAKAAPFHVVAAIIPSRDGSVPMPFGTVGPFLSAKRLASHSADLRADFAQLPLAKPVRAIRLAQAVKVSPPGDAGWLRPCGETAKWQPENGESTRMPNIWALPARIACKIAITAAAIAARKSARGKISAIPANSRGHKAHRKRGSSGRHRQTTFPAFPGPRPRRAGSIASPPDA